MNRGYFQDRPAIAEDTRLARHAVRKRCFASLLVITLVASVTYGILNLAGPSTVWMTSIGGLVILAAFAGVTRGLWAPVYLSPVAIFAGSLMTMGILGAHFYDSVRHARGAASLNPVLSLDQTLATHELFLIASMSTMIGALAARMIFPGSSCLVPPSSGTTRILKTVDRLSTPVAVMALVFSIGDLSSLIYRDVYIASHIASATTLRVFATPVSLAGAVLTGYLLATRRGFARVGAGLLAGLYAAVFLGQGTRVLALLPILLVCGYSIGRPTRYTAAGVGAALIPSLYLLNLPLFLRQLPSHGSSHTCVRCQSLWRKVEAGKPAQ